MLTKKQAIEYAKGLAGQVPTSFDLRFAFASAVPWAGRPDDGGDGGSGTDGAGTGDPNADDDDGNDGSTGSTTGDDNTGGDVKDPEKQRLSQEAANWRTKLRDAEKLLEEQGKKLREIEDKDKSELEKAQRDLKEATEELGKLRKERKDFAVKMAFFESGAAALVKNAAMVLKNLDLDGIEPDDDGQVDSKKIKSMTEAFLKEHPYMAADEEHSAGAGGDQPSGRPNNGKKSKDQVDYEALAKKFPALRR